MSTGDTAMISALSPAVIVVIPMLNSSWYAPNPSVPRRISVSAVRAEGRGADERSPTSRNSVTAATT